MNKIYLILIILFLITGCGSGKEGDASKYSINETNIKYVTTPSQNYILSILKANEYVDEIEPVTEKTDSNGKLNKDGGYYSAIFFSSNLVDYDTKKTVIDNGTDGGGCIESFKTEEDATERDKFLGKFKSSGGHVRLGTEVVRTSSLLDENDRAKLEESICNALLKGEGYAEYNPNEVLIDFGSSSVPENVPEESGSLEGIENNAADAYAKQEALITRFVNQVNEYGDSKIIKVEFVNNHTKATLKFDNGHYYTVWDQVGNSQVEEDFEAQVEFDHGKEHVDEYDETIAAVIHALSGYDSDTISSIIDEAKTNDIYSDEKISVAYNYYETAAGWQQGDHYRIIVDAYDYKK
jgi:hypothetical protein